MTGRPRNSGDFESALCICRRVANNALKGRAQVAAAAGKGGGEFYTPAEVGRLCAALLEPRDGDHIYDPTCGSGGLLLQ